MTLVAFVGRFSPTPADGARSPVRETKDLVGATLFSLLINPYLDNFYSLSAIAAVSSSMLLQSVYFV